MGNVVKKENLILFVLALFHAALLRNGKRIFLNLVNFVIDKLVILNFGMDISTLPFQQLKVRGVKKDSFPICFQFGVQNGISKY